MGSNKSKGGQPGKGMCQAAQRCSIVCVGGGGDGVYLFHFCAFWRISFLQRACSSMKLKIALLFQVCLRFFWHLALGIVKNQYLYGNTPHAPCVLDKRQDVCYGCNMIFLC